MDPSNIINLLKKLDINLYLAVFFGSLFIKYGDSNFLDQLGILETKTTYSEYIGYAIIVSASLLLAKIVISISKKIPTVSSYITDTINEKRTAKMRINQLYNLTNKEKEYLHDFVFNDISTKNFLIDDGTAGLLQKKRIISPATRYGDILRGTPYHIEPWAKEYLKKNPHLFD